jgi:hypothetical protein
VWKRPLFRLSVLATNRYKNQSSLWYGMFRSTGSKPWFSRTTHLWMRDAQKLVGVWFWVVNYHVLDIHVMMCSLSWTSIMSRCPPAGLCMPRRWVYPWTVEFKSFYDILVKNGHLVRMHSASYHLGNNTLGEHCWKESKHCQLYGQLPLSLPHTWLFAFYSVHRLEIEVGLAGILQLRTHNADDV